MHKKLTSQRRSWTSLQVEISFRDIFRRGQDRRFPAGDWVGGGDSPPMFPFQAGIGEDMGGGSHYMSRNYGLGTRDMSQAGRIALNRSCQRGELSFLSVDTIADRWAQFAAFAKGEGVGRMERITPELVQQYGRGLAEQVTAGKISAAYAQNMVSAINSVMHQVREWKSVSPTKDCGIAARSNVRDTPPHGIDRGHLDRALDALRDAGQHRGAAVAELARELGLRSKEASLLDAGRALKEARNRAAVTISAGTKGGRVREVPITRPEQLSALLRAVAAQGDARALIPPGQNWHQWRQGELRNTRETIQEHTGSGLHDLRAAYACDRYQSLTGAAAPVMGGQIQDRDADKVAREQISKELGHNRVQIVAAYVGGR